MTKCISKNDTLPAECRREFEEVEQLYEEHIVLFMQEVAAYRDPDPASSGEAGTSQPISRIENQDRLQLKRIRIPKFNDAYKNWTAFHDL